MPVAKSGHFLRAFRGGEERNREKSKSVRVETAGSGLVCRPDCARLHMSCSLLRISSTCPSCKAISAVGDSLTRSCIAKSAALPWRCDLGENAKTTQMLRPAPLRRFSRAEGSPMKRSAAEARRIWISLPSCRLRAIYASFHIDRVRHHFHTHMHHSAAIWPRDLGWEGGTKYGNDPKTESDF